MLSSPTVTTRLPSGEKLALLTVSCWSLKVISRCPLSASHTRVPKVPCEQNRRKRIWCSLSCGWRIVISPKIPQDSASCYHSAMRNLAVLFIHLIATLARLLGPGGVRSVVAESLLLKHQLLIVNRSRPRLRSFHCQPGASRK